MFVPNCATSPLTTMQPSSAYCMTAFRTGDCRPGSWENVPPHVSADIQIGQRFGVLMMDVECLCCGGNVFFAVDGNDDVRLATMRMKTTDGGQLVVRLPGDAMGRFERGVTADGFTDAYVLQILARSANNFSVEHLFGVLHRTIVLRTAFRRLYFRAFRRSFAPSANQGKRAIRDGITLLAEVLQQEVGTKQKRTQ